MSGYYDTWHVANNGPSKRPWFVCKGLSGTVFLRDKAGRIRRFKSSESADKARVAFLKLRKAQG